MSFLSDFVRYLKTRSDCPPDFYVHGGLAALSVALGNRVWCDGYSRDIYPNLWMVVIAPSGFGKSVPLDFSEAIVRKAGLAQHILPDTFSQEALNKALSDEPIGIFYLQEFSAFTGTLNREYNEGAKQWLTKLYDVPETEQRKLLTSTYVLKKPCITILGASSPEWFSESFQAKDLRGGFLARFIFCPSRTSGPYVEHPGPRNETLELGLADHLRQVLELGGKADFRQVIHRYNEWDRGVREELRRNTDPELGGMRSRLGTQVFKASMLFHVSEEPDNLCIRMKDLENAIKYVERSQKLAEDYILNEVARDRDDADRLRIREIVRRGGGRVEWGKALKDSHMTAFKFRNAVETLVSSGQLLLENKAGSKGQWLIERRLEVVA